MVTSDMCVMGNGVEGDLGWSRQYSRQNPTGSKIFCTFKTLVAALLYSHCRIVKIATNLI